MSSHEYTSPHQNLPPRIAAENDSEQVFTVNTGAAASQSIWGGYAAHAVSGLKTPEGKVWLELEAVGATAYVRFGTAATTATTAANGAAIVVGTPRRFFVDPLKDVYMDHFSGGGSLKWRRVGPIVERSRT